MKPYPKILLVALSCYGASLAAKPFASGRFVPERADDFAFENDKVAFRVYGPALVDSAESSGLDCWLKRVDTPIIDKWYLQASQGKSYHKDHGEGYDPYHVGSSLGGGGLALLIDGELVQSNVYRSYKILEQSPNRFSVEFEYVWDGLPQAYSERRKVTIEGGSQLFRVDSQIFLDGKPAQTQIAIGSATHDGKASTYADKNGRWVATWETINEAGLGTGVFLPYQAGGLVMRIVKDEPDRSHIVLALETDSNGRITYYAGYGWESAGEITTAKKWTDYLESFGADYWTTLQTNGQPVARHEAGLTAVNGKIYLLGGRRINPVSIFDPATQTWTEGASSPMEIHHFQPVVFKDEIWVIGAMTGRYPNETPVESILIYSPAQDAWRWGPEIPADRRRGGAGVSVNHGKIYLSCGIQRGHMGGYVSWFDVFDPTTGKWKKLPDAPHARDHFQSAIVDGKLYLAGGRRTSKETEQVFDLTVAEVDFYDFATQKWATTAKPLPTPRAGNTSFELNNTLLVIGGESVTQNEAHSEVECFHPKSENWSRLPNLNRGRHGTGVVLIDGKIFTASGSGSRGGKPELSDIEALIIRH